MSGIAFVSRVADGLAEHSASKEDYQFIEKNFSGVVPIEMKLTVRNDRHSFLEVDLMKEVEEIEKYLRDSCGRGTISPLALFRERTEHLMVEKYHFINCLNLKTYNGRIALLCKRNMRMKCSITFLLTQAACA